MEREEFATMTAARTAVLARPIAGGGKVVVHRDIKGNHADSHECWCDPLVVTADDLERHSVDELVALADARDRRH